MSVGSHRTSLRREIRSIERGLVDFQREVGDNITWYEFDAAHSTENQIFDEGPLPDPFDPQLDQAQGKTWIGDDKFSDADDGQGTWEQVPVWAQGGETFAQLSPGGTWGALGRSGRAYRAPVTIPAIWVRFLAPENVGSDAGEYAVNSIAIRISAGVMRDSGLASPFNPAAHFNDRFSYNGFLYRADDYAPRGWLHGAYLMVDISGRQLKEEELYEDTPDFWETPQASTAWTPGQQLAWPPTQPDQLEDTPT